MLRAVNCFLAWVVIVLQVTLVLAATLHLQTPSAASRGLSDFMLRRSSRAMATPTLLTFQGHVLDAQPVVVHVLVKAKLLQTGVYLLRTVLYTQKTALDGSYRHSGFSLKVAEKRLTVQKLESSLQATKLLHLLSNSKMSRWCWSIKKICTTMDPSHWGGLGCSLHCSACMILR